MTTEIVSRPLLSLPPIGLDELTERAALQTRVDRKYLVPAGEVDGVLAGVGPDTMVLEIDGARSFGYESVYFDTPDLVSYLLAARRRRRRFKVRTRTYLDSCRCWLEVKTRGSRGHTVKHRLEYEPDQHVTVAPGRQFIDSVLDDESISGTCGMVFEPVLVTRYRRSTLLLPAAESRVTIDTDLTWEHGRSRLRLPELAIIETKTGSTASCVDRLLWSCGYRPLRISKYATGLAALRPDLPATRWRRTLRQHFALADHSTRPREPQPPERWGTVPGWSAHRQAGRA
jgi:hypothetical protein